MRNRINEKTLDLESGMEKCPRCGSDVIEYDDHIEYGGEESNEGYHYYSMCSNDACENY